jgi:hypothetical protein
MAKARETTLWMCIEQNGKNRYVRMARSGKSYSPKVDGDYRPGSFYLRYREGDRRKWESVGTDLTVALSEQKARQAMLDNANTQPPAPSKSLEVVIERYLQDVLTIRGTKAHRRAERLLKDFSSVVKKTYLDEVNRD